MPYCVVNNEGAKIFYRKYGHGSTKVLLIIGLAATHEAWAPQIRGLTGSCEPTDDEVAVLPAVDSESDGGGIEVCSFDNRGVGRSYIPHKKSHYSTLIMAKDSLALLDHLGWKKAHVFGHSMGSMIASKLAAIAPDRLSSLALLNASGGGFECFPKINRRMLSIMYRFIRAKTPEQRAAVDLDTHYTKEYLDEYVGSTTRRKILHQEYVRAISSSGMQSSCGFDGQMSACWRHKMTPKELDTIHSSGFLISVIHGRYDVIAQLYHARQLAEKLQPVARMVELHGGHLVSHEKPDEVNQSLIELIKASKANVKPQDWSNLMETSHGLQIEGTQMSPSNRNREGMNNFDSAFSLLGKFQFGFLYLVGIFVMGFEYLRNIIEVKPVRVEASN